MTSQQIKVALLAELRAALDPEAVSTTADAIKAHARDWWPRSHKWSDEEIANALPLCVAAPTDVRGVQDVVRIAARHRTSVVPFGAGSGVCGAVCGGGHVSLDLRRLKRLQKFAPEAGYVVVEAGMLAAQLEQSLGEAGYTTGHYPQSLPLATVGGLVSTRSSGTFSTKYGNIENLVMGLTIVLADGRLIETAAPTRAATGPDLKQLFIGAEGTLGVITSVTLRVFRKPEKRTFCGYSFPSVEQGLRAVHQAFESHVVPAVLRLYDETEAAGLYRRAMGHEKGAPLLIVGHEGMAAVVDTEQTVFAELCSRHGAVALGHGIGDAWEQHRFDASWLERGNTGTTRMADAIEISAPWPALPEIYRVALARVQSLCTESMAHWSHFYSTGGAMYFIFMVEGADAESTIGRYEKVWDEVMRATLELGGCISHHHGVGRARQPYLKRELGSSAVLLSAVRHALDPQGVFNRDNMQVEASA